MRSLLLLSIRFWVHPIIDKSSRISYKGDTNGFRKARKNFE